MPCALLHEGFDLLYAAERVTPEVIETLFELADETKVYEKMARDAGGGGDQCIEGFESENRSVLHTAMRDQFDHRESHQEQKRPAISPKKNCKSWKSF